MSEGLLELVGDKMTAAAIHGHSEISPEEKLKAVFRDVFYQGMQLQIDRANEPHMAKLIDLTRSKKRIQAAIFPGHSFQDFDFLAVPSLEELCLE